MRFMQGTDSSYSADLGCDNQSASYYHSPALCHKRLEPHDR